MAQKSRPWFSSLFSIDRLFGFKELAAKGRRKRSVRLNLEALEDRTVPTIVFTPQFGPDSLVSSAPFNSPNNGVMSSATVYLILWGPAWSQTPTGTQENANTVINQTTAVVNSTQLSILDQYGSNGKATFGGFYIDNSTPPAGFGVATGSGFTGASFTTAENEITSAINGGFLPGPTGNPKLASAPIYAIVTDPNDSFDGNGNVSNGGVNRNGVVTSGSFNGDNINMIGVGTGFQGNNFEGYSATFSHELQEKMSEPAGRPSANPPPAGYGVVAIPPANIPPYIKDTPGSPVTAQNNWDQIADFEPEQGFTLANGHGGYGYIYRLGGVNGVEVQAAYSAANQAFVVEDGNSELFTLAPNWTIDSTNANNDKFDGTFDLTINGDQLPNKDDNITISEDSAGGIQVNLDGQIANFDPGTATTIGTAIRSISVNGLTGNNTLTLDFSNGNFLSVMNPNGNTLANGLIDYNGGTGPTGLLVLKGGSFTNEVDTATGLHSGVITLDGKTVTYSNLSPIIDTATATNFFINGVGAAGQTFNIVNDPNGSENGFTSAEVNGNGFEKVDFANKTNLTVKASINANLATAGPSTFAVDVTTAALGLSTLTLDGGGKGSTFNVQATPLAFSTTLVGSGTAGDAYNIFSDAGVGSPLLGNLAGVLGVVTVKADSSATNRLVVSDQGNVATPDVVTLTKSSILVSGGAAVTIEYSVAGGGAFTDGAANDGILILGPNLTAGGNVFKVLSSLGGSSTLEDGGSGSDAFYIADGGLGVGSTDTFNGQGGNNSFFITSAPPVSAAVYIDGGPSGFNVLYGPDVNSTWNITGANQGNIGGAVTAFKDIQYLIGGAGDDTFVFSTGASEGTINGGYGNNTVVGAPDQINAFDITGGNAGSVVGAIVAFGNIQNLAGSMAPGNTGTDVFEFYTAGGLAGHIAGGTGSEWLYYEPLSTPIWVNLSIGVVSRLGGGETHLANSPMNVIGSSVGGDIIIGDASGGVLEGHNGGNTIEAGGGRTIIIGGYGKNYLVGGPADDLIIAGTTVFDYDILALTSFLNEWQSTKSFATRVNDLRTGSGQPGGDVLGLNQTVFCPSTSPGPRFGLGGGEGQTTMVGGGGDNWFFTLYPTTIVDLQNTDVVD